MTEGIRRVVVLTADVGEGHLAAARVIADELSSSSPEIEVTTVDALELLGPTLRLVLRDAYRAQLRHVPWVFALLFAAFLRFRLLRAAGRLFLVAFGVRRMRRALESLGPDLVVSTYPAATTVLGTLRRRGHLDVPAYATVTDLAGVEFWAHRGIDLHLVMHESLVPLVEREAGAGSARVVAPLVAAPFRTTPDRAAARRALGLPQTRRVVLVSGGGWGVGDLAGAVAEAAALPETTVVCLTGRNERLHETLTSRHADDGQVRVIGFTDRMADLLAAADVVVHTTGGVTCLEAMALGRPIVAFGPPAGHAPTLARAMARLGVAAHARDRGELRAYLVAPPAVARSEQTTGTTDLLLAARCRTPLSTSRRRRVGATVVLASGAVAALLTFGDRSAFGVISDPFGARPRSLLPAPSPKPAPRHAAVSGRAAITR